MLPSSFLISLCSCILFQYRARIGTLGSTKGLAGPLAIDVPCSEKPPIIGGGGGGPPTPPGGGGGGGGPPHPGGGGGGGGTPPSPGGGGGGGGAPPGPGGGGGGGGGALPGPGGGGDGGGGGPPHTGGGGGGGCTDKLALSVPDGSVGTVPDDGDSTASPIVSNISICFNKASLVAAIMSVFTAMSQVCLVHCKGDRVSVGGVMAVSCFLNKETCSSSLVIWAACSRFCRDNAMFCFICRGRSKIQLVFV